jgi:aryl-alcohol dehydrogenase
LIDRRVAAVNQQIEANMGTHPTVRGAVFRKGSDLVSLETIDLGPLRDDEVLVRLVATGVCHTDLTFRRRLEQPVILGHEGAGYVEGVGRGVTKVTVGDAVVLSFLACGVCDSCEADAPSYCQDMRTLNQTGFRRDGSSALSKDGIPIGGHFFGQSSFATHSVANQRNVVKAPATAPLALLGPLGCGVQTGAGAVMNVLKPKAGSSLLIVGAGGVGMSALMAGVVEGCAPIIVIEPNADRRALAIELGAALAIDPITEDVETRLRQLLPHGVNHALDTSGLPAAIHTAIACLAARGAIALVSASPLDAALTIPILTLLRRGIEVRGVIEGDSVPDIFIPRLIDLMAQGRFPLERLVRYYDLDDINQALHDQESGLVIKPIIRMPA